MASTVSIISDEDFAAGLNRLRNRSLKPSCVRAVVAQLSAIVSRHAVKPAAAADEIIAVIVILRSGMAMLEPFVSAWPEDTNMVIYHLGLFRDRQTLQPVEYYNKLSKKNASIKHAYILDPLIATGGTAAAAIDIIK
jgi:uracil phosphoribosyltransferase